MRLPQIDDDVLGLLKYNESLEWYDGEIELGGKQMWLHLDPGEADDSTLTVARLRQIVLNLEHYSHAATRYAAERLLGLKNESWVDDEEEQVTAEEFVRRMNLESLVVYPTGAAHFGYDDGDLFWGHRIGVAMNPFDEFEDAEISG